MKKKDKKHMTKETKEKAEKDISNKIHVFI